MMETIKVGIVGLANTGKTTIFNKISNSSKSLGNFIGTTVSINEAKYKEKNREFLFSDLPGLNSLNAQKLGYDELISKNYITKNAPDVFLNIVNVNQLSRQLLFTSDLLRFKVPTIIVLNMVDKLGNTVAEIEEIKNKIEDMFKVQVVLFSHKEDVKGLIKAIEKAHKERNNHSPRHFENTAELQKGIAKLQNLIIFKSKKITDFLDKIFLHKVFGLPISLFMVFCVVSLSVHMHMIFSGFVGVNARLLLQVVLDPVFAFSQLGNFPLLQIVYGSFLSGVETVFGFVPILFTFYFFMSILEQSGYLSRQAFLLDRVMYKLRLPGSSIVALMLGFGCTVATTGACRTFDRFHNRVLVSNMATGVSCSAKLPVYVYLSTLFFISPSSIIFSLYIIGIIFSVLIGFFLSKSLLKLQVTETIIEMPSYSMPSFKFLLRTAFRKVKGFVRLVGKMIITFTIILNIFTSINFKGQMVKSGDGDILSSIAKETTVLLRPIGIEQDNWQSVLGILTGFLAKEVLVATLNALYFGEEEGGNISIGKEFKDNYGELITTLKAFSIFKPISFGEEKQEAEKKAFLEKVFVSKYALFAFLLFILLYTPCLSAMSNMAKELGLGWTSFVFFFSIFNAYGAAMIFYQTTQIKILGFNYLFYLMGYIGTYVAMFFIFKYINKNYLTNAEAKFIFVNQNKHCGGC